METQGSLEWIRSMRLQILDSLFELSNKHLQAAAWTNPNNTNPHYSLIEFVESSDVQNETVLAHHRITGVINDAEHTILLRLTQTLSVYSPPGGDWYNHEAVLHDPKWLQDDAVANSALPELLALSFIRASTPRAN